MRLKKGRVTCAGYVLLLCQSNQMFLWKNVSCFFFLNLVDKREWITERVWLSIQGRYPGFHEWLNWRGGHVEPCNITDVELDKRSRCISENTRGLVVQSVNESSWGRGTGMLGYTPCVFFFIHFIVQFDFVPGILFPGWAWNRGCETCRAIRPHP